MAYPFNTPVAASTLLYQERGEMGVGTTSMYPGWMQDLTGQGGLRKAVATGTKFANWMQNTLLPALKEAGETAKLTGRNIEKGGYVLEEFMESEHLGYRTRGSLDIGSTTLQEIGDVKVHTVRPKGPDPEASQRQAWLKKAEHYRTQEAQEQYARQQTIYGVSFENIYDLKMALATYHLSDSAAEFLMDAFNDPGVSAVDIATEIMGKGPGAPNQQTGKVAGTWLTDAVGQVANKADTAPPREVEVVPSPYLPEETMRPALESAVTAEQVFQGALGMSRSQFGRMVNQPPPGTDTENWVNFIALTYNVAQKASAGAFSVGYAVNEINKAKSLIPGHNEGDPLHKFESTARQALGRTPSQAEGRAGMARGPELTDVGNFEPLDIDAYGPNVLYNPGSGDVSIVHHREGSKYPEEYWRGNIQLLGEGDGSRIVVDGRLIAPMQVRLGESDAPSPVFDNPETILSRTLHAASMLVQEQGGGIAAIKSVRKHMGDALGSHPMWTEGSTGYKQRLLETHILDPRFSPEQQRAVIPSHLAVMKGGTYAVDHMRWAQATAGTIQHQTGKVSFGGGASKIRKRLQAASRGAESVLPMAWKETARPGRQPTRELDWDRSRVMLSPLLQTVTGKGGRRTVLEPEIGYKAKGAVTGHTILSEGTGMTSMESPMGQTKRHTLDIGGLVNFTPSKSNYFDKEAGGFVLGWVNDDRDKPVVHREAWDRFDVNPDSIEVKQEAGRTHISYKGTGSITDSDSRLKNWLFTKAVWAKTGLSEMVPGVSDLDFLLQGFYSPTQAIYSTIAAEYKDRPHELAVAIYGKDAASYIVGEKPEWGTTRKAQERLGKGAYQGVMMPTDPEHIKNYLGLGERLMTERMREKVEIEQPVSELELLGFQEAGIPHRQLGKRGKGKHATEWISLEVPALVSDFFMQTGVEYPGQAQFSAEELMNVVRDPGEHGEKYKQAILKGVFPQLMQQSGHKRRLYQDVLKGRFHREPGSGIEIPEEEMVDFGHIATLLGGTGKDAVEFMSMLKGLPPEMQHKFIKVGGLVVPPIRTLEGLSVPDDPGKSMFWLNQEEREALAIKQADVSQIVNSLRSVMSHEGAQGGSAFGSAYARLERGLYHKEEGLASQAEVLRGALSAQVTGHEGMAVSYPGIELGTVVMGKDKLMETFGTDDIPKIMEWLDRGQAVGLQRRPDIYGELTSFIPSQIVSVADAREKYGLTNIPEDFPGVAYPSALGAMALGDFDGDRIMSVLAAVSSEVSGPQGRKRKEFATDPAIMAAGSRSGLYARWGKAAAKMMGHESVASALQYGDDWDESMLTSEDVFDLNLMVGKKLSETAKQADTQKEEQTGYQRVLGQTEKGTEGRRRGLVQWLVGNLDKVTPDQARDALQDIAHGQGTILGRAANRLWREVPAYLAAMGLTEQHGSAASRKALMGYQLSVDVENLSPGLLEYMNLMEGFTPGKTRGASYVQRLSPAEPGGALKTEQLKDIGGQGDFSVRLMQSILDANEFWEPAEGGEDWGVGGTKGQEQSNKLRAQAITADEGLQKGILDVLQAGGDAQQIWDEVIGLGEDKFSLGQKDLDRAMETRFGRLWSSPGFLLGAGGASVAERMTRSGPQAYNRSQELNELTGGMWGELAKAGTQMKASIDILSSKGGIDIIKQLGNMPNREGADAVFGNLLSWMGESPTRNIKSYANPADTNPGEEELIRASQSERDLLQGTIDRGEDPVEVERREASVPQATSSRERRARRAAARPTPAAPPPAPPKDPPARTAPPPPPEPSRPDEGEWASVIDEAMSVMGVSDRGTAIAALEKYGTKGGNLDYLIGEPSKRTDTLREALPSTQPRPQLSLGKPDPETGTQDMALSGAMSPEMIQAGKGVLFAQLKLYNAMEGKSGRPIDEPGKAVFQQLQEGDFTQAQIIEQLSQGVSGSRMTATGAMSMAASLGVAETKKEFTNLSAYLGKVEKLTGRRSGLSDLPGSGVVEREAARKELTSLYYPDERGTGEVTDTVDPLIDKLTKFGVSIETATKVQDKLTNASSKLTGVLGGAVAEGRPLTQAEAAKAGKLGQTISTLQEAVQGVQYRGPRGAPAEQAEAEMLSALVQQGPPSEGGGGRLGRAAGGIGRGINRITSGMGLFYVNRMLGMSTGMAQRGIGAYAQQEEGARGALWQSGDAQWYTPQMKGWIAPQLAMQRGYAGVGRRTMAAWGDEYGAMGDFMSEQGGNAGWLANALIPAAGAGLAAGYFSGNPLVGLGVGLAGAAVGTVNYAAGQTKFDQQVANLAESGGKQDLWTRVGNVMAGPDTTGAEEFIEATGVDMAVSEGPGGSLWGDLAGAFGGDLLAGFAQRDAEQMRQTLNLKRVVRRGVERQQTGSEVEQVAQVAGMQARTYLAQGMPADTDAPHIIKQQAMSMGVRDLSTQAQVSDEVAAQTYGEMRALFPGRIPSGFGGTMTEWAQRSSMGEEMLPRAIMQAQLQGRGAGSVTREDVEGALEIPTGIPGKLQDQWNEIEQNVGNLARQTGDFDLIVGGLGDSMEMLYERNEALGQQAVEYIGTAMGAGLDIAIPTLTGAETEQDLRTMQKDLDQTLAPGLAMKQQVMQMTGGDWRVAKAIGSQFEGDPGGAYTTQRLLAGDQQMMSVLAQGSVQGPFQPMVDVGLGQVDSGKMRSDYLGTIQTRMEAGGYNQDFIAETMVGITQTLNDLRPTTETETGHRMGTTRMWEGWSADVTGGAGTGIGRQARRAQYLEKGDMHLPMIGGYGGVDEDLFGRFADILEDEGTRGLQAQQVNLQNQYKEFQFGQQEQALDWSKVSQLGGTFEAAGVGEITTRGSLEITKELRSLGRMWEDFTSTYNERSREVQRSQFMENWQVRSERMPQQFEWKREDLAFQGAQAGIQYGWGMEDIQEQMRFATGRDRRKLQRQAERSTISYGMQMGRLDTQGGRLDTQEQWGREDLDRQKRQFLERNRLQDDYQSRYRSHMMQRRQLDDEMHAIREFSARFQIQQAEEALGEQRRLEESMKAINAAMMVYTQEMENATAQVGQVVQFMQFLFANVAVGGGGEMNLPAAAQGAFAQMNSDFNSLFSSPINLPVQGNRR